MNSDELKQITDHLKGEFFLISKRGARRAVIAAAVILGLASTGTYWKAKTKAEELLAAKIPNGTVEEFLKNAELAKQIVKSGNLNYKSLAVGRERQSKGYSSFARWQSAIQKIARMPHSS